MKKWQLPDIPWGLLGVRHSPQGVTSILTHMILDLKLTWADFVEEHITIWISQNQPAGKKKSSLKISVSYF